MTRYQIVLAYDGSKFSGSQRQTAKSRTVQGEFEKSLRKLGWVGNSVILAGRTDTGVHAAGQVASFDIEWRHPLEELVTALNANLPLDIAARSAKVVPADFHPRFDAISRRYQYKIFCKPLRDPLRERYAWRVWPQVNGNNLHKAARFFLGQHDFAAFGSAPKRGNGTVRTVVKSSWESREDEWIFEVQADAFLYRMVRKLVFVQVAVGQERLSTDVIADALNGQLQNIPGGLAPPNGLTLIEVTYPIVTDISVQSD